MNWFFTEKATFSSWFIDISTDIVQIKEYFLELYTVNDSTWVALTHFLIQALTKTVFNSVTAQGYDNEANVNWKNNGVQKRILDINLLALWVVEVHNPLIDLSKSGKCEYDIVNEALFYLRN